MAAPEPTLEERVQALEEQLRAAVVAFGLLAAEIDERDRIPSDVLSQMQEGRRTIMDNLGVTYESALADSH